MVDGVYIAPRNFGKLLNGILGNADEGTFDSHKMEKLENYLDIEVNFPSIITYDS